MHQIILICRQRSSWNAPEVSTKDQRAMPPLADLEVNKTRLQRLKTPVKISFLSLILVAAIAISFGVAFGLKRSSSAEHSPPELDSEPRIKHIVTNHSSIAAVITTEGAKHIFFQSINGTILETVSNSLGSTNWTSSMDIVVASDTRDHTPMTSLFRIHVSPDFPVSLPHVSM